MLGAKVQETTHARTHTRMHAHGHSALTCFILSKGDDVFVVGVDQFGKSAGLVSAHADLVVLPFAGGDVLLQRHQPPERQQNSALVNISSPVHYCCASIPPISEPHVIPNLSDWPGRIVQDRNSNHCKFSRYLLLAAAMPKVYMPKG